MKPEINISDGKVEIIHENGINSLLYINNDGNVCYIDKILEENIE